MILFIITATIYFGFVTFIAQKKAPETYSRKYNTLSELGCQTYENRGLMQWGFKGLGIIIMAGVLNSREIFITEAHYMIPLSLFSLFIFLSGVFSSKPFEHLVFYSLKESRLHNLLLQLSGLSMALLVVMKFVVVIGVFNRILNITVLVGILYTSAHAARKEGPRGLYQRVMYTIFFLWLIYAFSGIM